jgi:hypothetical protein
MNQRELRAYAVRGLSVRLAELDQERARIVDLLSQWDGPAARPPREARAKADAPVEGATALAPERPVRTARAQPEPPAGGPEPEEARILPRRRGPHPTLGAAAAAPVLPPMPRLVKARAS